MDARVTDVKVLNQALDGTTTYAHLVSLTSAGTDWNITGTTSVSTITMDTEVPLTIEVTDLFFQKLRKEVKVLVKK